MAELSPPLSFLIWAPGHGAARLCRRHGIGPGRPLSHERPAGFLVASNAHQSFHHMRPCKKFSELPGLPVWRPRFYGAPESQLFGAIMLVRRLSTGTRAARKLVALAMRDREWSSVELYTYTLCHGTQKSRQMGQKAGHTHASIPPWPYPDPAENFERRCGQRPSHICANKPLMFSSQAPPAKILRCLLSATLSKRAGGPRSRPVLCCPLVQCVVPCVFSR